MRNAYVAFGIFVLSVFLVGRAAAAQNLLSATVVIQAEARNGHIQTGAGVIVSDDGVSLRIVSAGHIFRESTDGHVGFYVQGSGLCCVLSIQEVHLDTTDDLAVVTVAKPAGLDDSAASLSKAAPSLGEKLTITGNPNGKLFVASSGTVVSTGVAKYGFAFDCDTCGPGDSGGGIFNAQGQLIGVLLGVTSFTNSQGQVVLLNASFGVPASAILNFLAEVRANLA